MNTDDLPMGGCAKWRDHQAHLAVGYQVCENQRAADFGRLGTFGTVVIDPPWSYSYSTRKSEAGNNGWRGSTDRHYRTLTLADIKGLPVPLITATNSVLWLWAVTPLLDDAISVMSAWGFDYKNTLTWAKTTRDGRPATGMGYWMRGATEHLLLGVKGNPKPLRRNQPTWFPAPPLRHSAKPEAAYRIVQTLSPGPHADIFARTTRPGWVAWGDQADQ